MQDTSTIKEDPACALNTLTNNSVKDSRLLKGSKHAPGKDNGNDVNHKDELKMTLITLSAGAIAGAMAKTAIAPLDRTKINFQSSINFGTLNVSPFTIRAGLKFMQDTVKKEKEKMLLKSNGSNILKSKYRHLYKSWSNIKALGALWRGNSATMLRICPFAAIQFASHRKWKSVLGVDHISYQPELLINNYDNKRTKNSTYIQKLPENFRRFLAGSLAGVSASSMTYPLDLARARMAVTDTKKYSNLYQVFGKLIKEEGWISLYRGFTPTVLGSIPYAGTSFFTYESLKKLDIERYQKSRQGRLKGKIYINKNTSDGNKISEDYSISPIHRMFYGALAGLAGQTSSYPLDVIRRRMQTTPLYVKRTVGNLVANNDKNSLTFSSASNFRSNVKCPYTGILSTAMYIIKTEGFIKGMYKGLSMNWIKGPIAVGISFSTFDTLHKHIENVFLS
ncbi:unnamed protein product [Gordionus sp. m RMFG-2023]